MEKQFCSYEIALKLKALGFDEECLGYFYGKQYPLEIAIPIAVNKVCNDFNCIKAPLWQQVIDWLREKHNIEVEVYYALGAKKYEWQIDDTINGIDIDDKTCTQFEQYSDAREQAILKALELI